MQGTAEFPYYRGSHNSAYNVDYFLHLTDVVSKIFRKYSLDFELSINLTRTFPKVTRLVVECLNAYSDMTLVINWTCLCNLLIVQLTV